jgi:hypothetical protein
MLTLASAASTASTPLWVPLVIAVLGVLGTVVGTVLGVVLTQRRSDRREDLQWTHMREREREQLAREDSLRTFDQRRIAYLEFEELLRTAALAVSDTRSRSELDEEWQVPVFQSLLRLQVFATPATTAAAVAAYDALLRWGETTSEANSYHSEAAYDTAHDQYLAGIRKDLRIDSGGTDLDQST